MRRGILLLLSVLFGAARVARSDEQILYWQIDSANEYAFDYAVVYAVRSENLEGCSWTCKNGFGEIGAIGLPTDITGGIAWDSVSGGMTTDIIDLSLESLKALEGENLSAYSFYIELMQEDASGERRVGISEVASYNDLSQNHHILGTNMTIPSNLVIWRPKTTPEPTGALLLLIGASALALRRRRHA